jgi:hypothetical protein
MGSHLHYSIDLSFVNFRFRITLQVICKSIELMGVESYLTTSTSFIYVLLLSTLELLELGNILHFCWSHHSKLSRLKLSMFMISLQKTKSFTLVVMVVTVTTNPSAFMDEEHFHLHDSMMYCCSPFKKLCSINQRRLSRG